MIKRTREKIAPTFPNDAASKLTFLFPAAVGFHETQGCGIRKRVAAAVSEPFEHLFEYVDTNYLRM